MKEILEALSSASPNIERKLYTILTGSNAGKKYLRKTGSSADSLSWWYVEEVMWQLLLFG